MVGLDKENLEVLDSLIDIMKILSIASSPFRRKQETRFFPNNYTTKGLLELNFEV